MKLGKNTDTITFGSGVIILTAAIIILAVIHARQPAHAAMLAEAPENTPTVATATPSKTALPKKQVRTGEITADGVKMNISPGWIIYIKDYFTVRVPDGAVAENNKVAVSLREAEILSLANEDGWDHILMANIDLTDERNMLLPSNRFAADVEICFTMDDATQADYLADPTRYRVEIFNSETSPVRWQALPTTAGSEPGMLCGSTRTASLYAAAVYQSEPTAGSPVIGSD